MIWNLLHFAVLLLFGSFVVTTAQNVVYVGRGAEKSYFALRSTYDWLSAINYCHNYGYMAATITTANDFNLTVNFLHTAEDMFPPGVKRSFWLPATDHRVEGKFQWISTLEEVKFEDWTDRLPITNRSANCLLLNSDGSLEAEPCYGWGIHHYVLCATPVLLHLKSSETDTLQKTQRLERKGTLVPKQDKFDMEAALRISPTLTPIGGVGNKLYFVDTITDNEQRNLFGLLDFCHEVGMRLAAPETQEEFDFLQEYVKTATPDNYQLAATDTLSMSCLKSNSEFRWFYSGNVVTNSSLIGDHWWYKCVSLYPNGLYAPDCFGGSGNGVLCELESNSNP